MWWRPSPVTVVVLTIAVGLVGNLATNTVQVSAGWWPPVVWAVTGVLVALAVVSEWARSRSPSLESVSGVDEWTEGLAQGVQTLWRREEDHRRVHDPVALPVRWHPATSELAEDWANILRLPAGVTAQPLALTGRIERIAEVYRTIPSGRLVILGQAGAGKTVLAARLALNLLADRRPGEPVPVIVSVGSWNPETTQMHVWLARQLARDHPGLAAPVQKGGPTQAAALIAADRVLPILDGFDEIDAGLHPAALRQLNTITDTPIVITSRAEEYTTAVHSADVLTAAAVIELDDLTLQDLAAYLPRTAAGPRTGIWDPVLERLRAEPPVPGPATLRQMLTNPLMVFLARTIYSDTPGHDPTELLDTHRFPTTTALQDHLLAAFLPAVYQADRPGSTRRWWPAHSAHRYLTYLARHLHTAGTYDLAWWQLRDTIPRWRRTLIFAGVDGLVTTLVFGLVGWLAYGFMDGLVTAFAVGLVTALASGLTVALTVGLLRRLRGPRPGGKPRFAVGKFTIALAVALAVALTVGLLVALAVGLLVVLAAGPTVTVVFGRAGAAVVELAAGLGLLTAAVFGLVAGLAAGFIGLRSAGPQPTRTRLQVRGRARFIVGRFAVGFGVGLAASAVVGLAASVVVGTMGVLADSVGYGLVFGCMVGSATAVVFGLEALVHAADVVSAAESLARDRQNAIRKMLANGLAAGLVGGLGNGLTFGLAIAVVVAFVSVRATSAWMYWLVLVRGWLPLTGRLPWRVQAFLTDAYQRGVLRQPGAVYQFRHARLQDHLIVDTPSASS